MSHILFLAHFSFCTLPLDLRSAKHFITRHERINKWIRLSIELIHWILFIFQMNSILNSAKYKTKLFWWSNIHSYLLSIYTFATAMYTHAYISYERNNAQHLKMRLLVILINSLQSVWAMSHVPVFWENLQLFQLQSMKLNEAMSSFCFIFYCIVYKYVGF